MPRRRTWPIIRYWLTASLLSLAVTIGPSSLAAQGGHTPESAPSARYGHSLVNVNGRVLLFGGKSDPGACAPQGDCNDLWEFVPGTRQFRQIVPNNTSLSPRYLHGAAEFEGELYLVGGNHEGAWLSDMWHFATSTNTWAQGISPGHLTGRGQVKLTAVRTYLYMVPLGGGPPSYYRPAYGWQDFPIPAGFGIREGDVTAPVKGMLCVFTGPNPHGQVDCDFWVHVPLDTAPPYLHNAAIAWWGNTVWLFGGTTWAGPSKQVWQYTFTGTDHTDVRATVIRLPDLPEERVYAAAAPLTPKPAVAQTTSTIPASLPIVIFGGQSSSGEAMADTLIYTVTVSANFVYLPLTMR